MKPNEVRGEGRVSVEVVCAWPGRVWLRRLDLPSGSTVLDAVNASGCQQALADEVLGDRYGVFGQIVEGGRCLRDGDRVEIYRPLLADPKEARRQRAADASLRRR